MGDVMPMYPTKAAFELCDVLNTQLFLVNGVMRGAERRKFKVGPWELEVNFSFVSDELGPERISGFARVAKDLWLYLLSEPEKGILRCWAVDGQAAKLGVSTVREFGSRRFDETLNKLNQRGAIVGQYEFKDEEWSEVT